MMGTVCLRFTLALALLLVGASSTIGQTPARTPRPVTPPPARPEPAKIAKMEPTELIRGATLTFTGRNFPDKLQSITVILDPDTETPISGNPIRDPIRIGVGADKTGKFEFVVPSKGLDLGRHTVSVEFTQPDGSSSGRIRPDDPIGGAFTVYGELGKTTPKITAINPVLSYPENGSFRVEILGEGFSQRASDNILFREGLGDLPVCWGNDPCDNPRDKAHGRAVSDRLIVLEGIPKKYYGNSKIGVRVGVLKSETVAMTMSRVERQTPPKISLVGFVVLFGSVFWIVGRGLRKNRVSGESPNLLTAWLLDKETDTLSLSKLQFFLWTSAAVFGYLYLAAARSLVQGKLEFVDVPEGLPGIILISAATTVAAQGITAVKGAKGAGEVHPSAADLVTVGGVVAPERFQFLIWTIIGVLAFVFLVALQDPGTIQELPKVPGGFMELMGVSSAGYLGGKLARKPGPIIDEIVATEGSLKLEIRGRGLSRDASFRIADVDVTSDKITSPDTTSPGKPAIKDKDTQTADANMAKVLEMTINDPKPEWLVADAKLTIINPDGQAATWPYTITKPAEPDAEADENSVDGCDVVVDEPTPDEDLPASEGGVGVA